MLHRILVLAISLVTAPIFAQASAPSSPHPNVVIFLIDDLGGADLGVDGSKFHETPRLDALAASGVRFTSFYSAHAVCSPTRAALMTGKAPQRVGITDWIHPGSGVALPAAERTIGEAFRANGYQTAYFGKWHLGEADADQPTRHGFDYCRGVNRAGQPASYFFPYRRAAGKSGIEETFSLQDVPDFDMVQRQAKPGESTYLTDVLTSGAIDFVRRRDAGRPFFLCLGHYAVHTPIQPPPELAKKYRERRARDYGDSTTPTVDAPFKSNSRGRQDDAGYAAMVENLDQNVGRFLDALADAGLRENTIVVFTSDNGGLCTLGGAKPGPTCNLPWRGGKGWHYEGGIRIPTCVSWPGTLRPTTSALPATTADLYPTLLELCELPLDPDQHCDGRSLARVLRGETDATLADRPLAWYYPHDHGSGHKASAAIRRGAWKLIHYLADERSELYDLAADPGEKQDQAAKEPERVKALRDELLSWIEQTRRIR